MSRETMLDKIESKLNEIKSYPQIPMEAVAYGLLPNSEDLKRWNYLVFRRYKTRSDGTSRRDFNDYYTVSVVHEDFIPDGYIPYIINKMKEIKGLKLADNDIVYDYTRKGGTDVIVEVATAVFTKASKGVNYNGQV